MKRLAIALVAIIAVFSLGYAQKGHSTFGIDAGYASKNQSAAVALFYQFSISNSLRIAPSVGAALRHHDLDAFVVNLNVHFPFRLGLGKVGLYPLVGVNYSSWNTHLPEINDSDDVSSRVNRFGVNAGAGFEILATSSLKVKLEAQYTLMVKYSTAYITAGIGYRF